MDKCRKRTYRRRVKCSKCHKEIDSDYQQKHVEMKHTGAGANKSFTPVLEKNQIGIGSIFFKSTSVVHKHRHMLPAAQLHPQVHQQMK